MLVGVLGLAAGVRWLPPEQAADLRPRPDALEYEETARNLARGKGYWLFVAGEQYPPEHPFGFPILLAPAVYLAGETPGVGVLVVLACALVTVAATWSLGRTCAGTIAAATAAFLVALSPLHVRMSQVVMSDVPAAAATTGIAAGMLMALGRSFGSRAWLALGIATGLAAPIRFTSVLVVIPAVASLALAASDRAGWMRRAVALAAGTAIGLIPLLIHQASRFGSPLATAADYWWPPAPLFGWEFALRAPRGGGNEPNLTFYARTLAGAGGFYSWPVAVLASLGVVHAFRHGPDTRAAATFALVSVLVTVAFYGPFNWQAERFLLPVLPLCAIMAALPLARGGPLLRTAAVALLALAVALLVRAGEPFGPPHKVLHEPTTLQAIDRLVEPDAVLAVRTNPYFFERFLRRAGTDRIWAPLGLCERRFIIRWNRVLPYARAQNDGSWVLDVFERVTATDMEAAVRSLLATGRPVYVSTLLDFQVPFLPGLLRLLATRFDLEPIPGVPRWQLLRVRARSVSP